MWRRMVCTTWSTTYVILRLSGLTWRTRQVGGYFERAGRFSASSLHSHPARSQITAGEGASVEEGGSSPVNRRTTHKQSLTLHLTLFLTAGYLDGELTSPLRTATMPTRSGTEFSPFLPSMSTDLGRSGRQARTSSVLSTPPTTPPCPSTVKQNISSEPPTSLLCSNAPRTTHVNRSSSAFRPPITSSPGRQDPALFQETEAPFEGLVFGVIPSQWNEKILLQAQRVIVVSAVLSVWTFPGNLTSSWAAGG